MHGQHYGTTSYDPRSWVPSPVADPLPAREAQKDARGSPIIAAVAAGLILTSGAVAAYFTRAEAPSDVAEASAAEPAAAQAAEAPPEPLAQRRAFTLPDIAEVEAALVTVGLEPADASGVSEALRSAVGTQGGEIRVLLEIVGASPVRLIRLSASRTDGSGGTVTPLVDGGFDGKAVAAQLSTSIQTVRGEMDSDSFYSSAVSAGVPDLLIPPFAAAFAYDFDFQREIKAGDVFEAAFERTLDAAGRPVGQPRLVYASLRTDAKSRHLYFYAPEGREGGWFDGNGSSIIKALMRTPVDGARVTSKFGFRTHPISGFKKLHKGTDFAAPTGTPIFAAGTGVAEFVGPRGGNGNFIRLRHDNGWYTLYLHLNRFAPGMAAGVRVSQGQQIGEVGTTGYSTGPHLHYEVHIDGQPVDPLQIETGSGEKLSGPALEDYFRERDRIDVSRASQLRQ